MEYISRITHTATGIVDYFTVPFSYIKKEDVHVKVDSTESEYDWLDDHTVTLSPLPVAGTIIEIYRDVEKKDRLVKFRDGSFLTEGNMNLDSTQHFMISQEAYDLARKSVLDSAETKATANKAIKDSTEALQITSGMEAAMLAASEAAQSAAQVAEEALKAAEDSTHGHTNKASLDMLSVDTTGSFDLSVNGNRVAFESELLDESILVGTDASNADALAFRTLVGMPEVESDISELSVSTAKTDGSNITVEEWRSLLGVKDTLAIAPQTIVKGAVGEATFGCDPLAEHLEISTTASSELVVHSGLQVSAGVDGVTVLSEELASDSSLDMSSKANGTHYIYANLNEDGTYAGFGSNDTEPQVGLNRFPSRVNEILASNTGVVDTAFASSVYGANEDVYKAVDNDNSYESSWMGDLKEAFPHYIGLYRSNPILVKAISIDVVNGTASGNIAMKDFVVQGTNDTITGSGVSSTQDYATWVDIEQFQSADYYNDYSLTVYPKQVFTLTQPQNYNAYRLKILNRWGTSSVGYTYTKIAELALLGDNATDFYNTATHTHYGKDGNSISRVYLGECKIDSGVIVDIINYQHGTTVTMPVNAGVEIGVNSLYYLDKPFLGYCTSQARIYAEGKWGKTGWLFSSPASYGTRANFTDGVLSVQTGKTALTAYNFNSGSEFTTLPTSAPAKVTVERSW